MGARAFGPLQGMVESISRTLVRLAPPDNPRIARRPVLQAHQSARIGATISDQQLLQLRLGQTAGDRIL